MQRLVELILAITDLAEAELAHLRRGAEQLVGSTLLMLAVFVFAVGGATIALLGVYRFLVPPLGEAGAATLMGAAGVLIALLLGLWLQTRARED